MSEESYVRFEDVRKSYDGETLVVRSLDIDLPKGEFVTILGPSGSGKTTCLMMLAGFETPTHGKIYLDGQPLNDRPPHKRNIGVVFQNYALFPHMTVAENLAFPLQVRGIGRSETEEKVNKALDMVQLGGFGERMPAQLSGGQQQRVAVARALVFDPKLVLMDEPLGALDKQLREQMQYEIKRIHENLGVTVVYVTHNQSEALMMSDRIAVFNEGIVQQLAPPDVLYEQPNNSFVAQFIGESNQLRGTLNAMENGEAEVMLSDGTLVLATPVNVEGVGQETLLSLRPERVIFNPDTNVTPTHLPAKVIELIYLGDHIRTRMAVAGQDDFIVKIQNDSDHASLSIGDTLTIGWRSQDCRALDAT
ncbi:MAG: ABC transporter ATP-binding protein [Alphaproteobacteria bacterium]|nr:ABC transporter ATP-binding protein [Alphaproteobacteria bacterium]